MPKRVAELDSLPEEKAYFLRGKVLEFLRKSPDMAYTLKEIFKHFLQIDKKSGQKYQKSKQVLYHLVYGYLREFKLKKLVIHKGNYYYYYQGALKNAKK